MTDLTCLLSRSYQVHRLHLVVPVTPSPDAIAAHEDKTEAFREMGKALIVAVSGRIKLGLDLAPPMPCFYGDKAQPHPIGLPAILAAKASAYALWRAAGLSKVVLAERMAVHEKEVRRD